MIPGRCHARREKPCDEKIPHGKENTLGGYSLMYEKTTAWSEEGATEYKHPEQDIYLIPTNRGRRNQSDTEGDPIPSSDSDDDEGKGMVHNVAERMYVSDRKRIGANKIEPINIISLKQPVSNTKMIRSTMDDEDVDVLPRLGRTDSVEPTQSVSPKRLSREQEGKYPVPCPNTIEHNEK
jgi:hypothetical protein